MKMFVVLAVLLAFLLTWGANDSTSGGSLKTVEVNTSAFWCDGMNHALDTGLSGVRVRKVYLWFGAWDYVNADIIATVEKIDTDGGYQSIAKAGWDHYTTPTGVAGQALTFDFAPDWIAVRKGEALKLYAQCNPMNEETREKKAHVIALIYYQ